MTRSVKKDAPLPLFLPRWNPPAPGPRHDQVHPPKGLRHQIVQEQGAPMGRDRPPSTRRHPRDTDRILGLDGPAAQSIQPVPHPVERAAPLVIRQQRAADPEGARFLGREEARLALGVLPQGRPVRGPFDPRLGEEGVSDQGAPPWGNDSADPVPGSSRLVHGSSKDRPRPPWMESPFGRGVVKDLPEAFDIAATKPPARFGRSRPILVRSVDQRTVGHSTRNVTGGLNPEIVQKRDR